MIVRELQNVVNQLHQLFLRDKTWSDLLNNFSAVLRPCNKVIGKLLAWNDPTIQRICFRFAPHRLADHCNHYTGCFFYLETGSTLSPDFILRPMLLIDPFSSPWDCVQSNEGSDIFLSWLYAERQAPTLKPLFLNNNTVFFKILLEKDIVWDSTYSKFR